jgi:hypothetical protein
MRQRADTDAASLDALHIVQQMLLCLLEGV